MSAEVAGEQAGTTRDGKAFATLAAAAALGGSTLYRLDDGRFLLARWGLSRELDTLDDVANFLRAMGIRTP